VDGVSIPTALRIRQEKPYTMVELTGKKRSMAATPLDPQRSLHFIQYKMDFDVRLEIDGQAVEFPARGNAETFARR
jgi:hypothetical protein